MENSPVVPIFGCIMMGGQSRRFGAVDKCQFNVGGLPIFEHVLSAAADQVDEIMLGLGVAGNGYNSQQLPVVTDVYRDAGPMAGLHAAMLWASQQMAARQEASALVATFACDTPSFPRDMVARLSRALAANDGAIALPRHKGRVHTALGLWSINLLPELVRSIEANQLALTRWAIDQQALLVDFDDAGPLDFFNINMPEDAVEYERMLRGQ